MSRLTIRDRRPGDLQGCADVLRAVHEADAYPLNWPADPQRWLTPPRLLRAWIAEDADGTIAGHVAVQDSVDDRAELSRLFVAPAARRRSVASALVRHVRSWAAEHSYGLMLEVAEERRSAAVDFYEATGWQPVGASDADWATADGRPVRLRRYVLETES